MQIELKFPVTVDGTEYAAVKVRRAKAKDMRVLARHMTALGSIKDGGAVTEDTVCAMIDMVASLTDTPVKVVEEFDMDDLNNLSERVASFFPDSGAASMTTGEG